MMKRGFFEEVEGLSIVSISDINFAYNTNMEGYTTLSSDIPKLNEIFRLLWTTRASENHQSCRLRLTKTPEKEPCARLLRNPA